MLQILTIMGYKSLPWWGYNPYVLRLKIFMFWGYKSLRLGLINFYVMGL